jgi:hypothetical protein
VLVLVLARIAGLGARARWREDLRLPAPIRVFSTTFALRENPISEHGAWRSARQAGIDWADIKTTTGFATGDTMSVEFADPTAILSGAWGPDQAAEATVYSVNPNASLYEEVELRLRSAVTPHRNTGYEITWKCSQTADSYYSVARWDGPLGAFKMILGPVHGPANGVTNGDVVRATIVGSVIRLYKNGVLIDGVEDDTFKAGAPGIGFYILPGRDGSNSPYGFTRFRAESF